MKIADIDREIVTDEKELSRVYKESTLIIQLKKLHEELECALIAGDNLQIETKLQEIAAIAKTETYYIGLTTYLYMQQKYQDALVAVADGLQAFAYSYSLYFNAALINYELANYRQCFTYFGKALLYSKQDDEIEVVETNIAELIEVIQQQQLMPIPELKEALEEIQKITTEGDERTYPLNKYGDSVVRKVLDKGTEYENMTNMYKSILLNDVDGLTRYLSKTEYFIGKEDKVFNYQFAIKTTLPISLLEKETDIEITINKEKMDFSHSTIKFNQYNYLTFEPGEVSIKTNKPIFVGEPIPLKEPTKKYQLIAHFFIDGLSAKYLEGNNVSELMPNITKLFKNKYVNTNCYTSADWTFPSNAGLVTALDTVANGQYHPNFSSDFSLYHTSLIGKIRKAGYYTAAFTGDWRGTPLHGYGKSFNRVVFKNAVGGFGTGEVIDEVVDHLETFKDKNNYIWLTLPELHDIADETFADINGQVNIPVTGRVKAEKAETSVKTTFNKGKIMRYGEELKRIDLHLGLLLRYIQTQYTEEDVLIIIHSDHGQGYFVENPKQFLHEERTKVPFMLLGGDMQGMSNNLMSNLDIYPTILKILNISYDDSVLHGHAIADFGGEQRQYALTECYHPKQSYKAVIHTDDLVIYFETIDIVDNYGAVDLEKYVTDVEVINKNLSTQEIADLVTHYSDLIIQKRAILQN